MHLLVEPSGGKYWRMAYRFAGKQKSLALGVYPDITLRIARAAASEEARDKRRRVPAQRRIGRKSNGCLRKVFIPGPVVVRSRKSYCRNC
ncbi:MAG: Arm DNA-binding domain-containing protein [Steroidobacterales bacterium]